MIIKNKNALHNLVHGFKKLLFLFIKLPKWNNFSHHYTLHLLERPALTQACRYTLPSHPTSPSARVVSLCISTHLCRLFIRRLLARTNIRLWCMPHHGASKKSVSDRINTHKHRTHESQREFMPFTAQKQLRWCSHDEQWSMPITHRHMLHACKSHVPHKIPAANIHLDSREGSRIPDRWPCLFPFHIVQATCS